VRLVLARLARGQSRHQRCRQEAQVFAPSLLASHSLIVVLVGRYYIGGKWHNQIFYWDAKHGKDMAKVPSDSLMVSVEERVARIEREREGEREQCFD
jgi:hypothetical protein